jgi:coenzyme PQQ precursor peptide PqqA
MDKPAHENHDPSFMILAFRAPALAVNIGRGGAFPPAGLSTEGLDIMKWETPEAVDFRFGMEITMYVANR